jgi:hypothetical protein
MIDEQAIPTGYAGYQRILKMLALVRSPCFDQPLLQEVALMPRGVGLMERRISQAPGFALSSIELGGKRRTKQKAEGVPPLPCQTDSRYTLTYTLKRL